MSVLTISREIGSGGYQIGRQIAERLGYHFVDKEIIDQVFHQYGFIPFEKVYETPTSFWDQFDQLRSQTLDHLNAVIQGVARHGNVVIVGRGSFAVLSGLADVLNVRIQAPFPDRVHLFMEEEHVADLEQATIMLEERDIVRSAFVESTYQVPWDAASNFDLVVNTQRVRQDRIVDLLSEILIQMDAQKMEYETTTKSFPVEPFMANAVRGALKCQESH